MKPRYDLEKIKFGIDNGSWTKAVGLYENGRVKNFQDTGFTWVADVLGTQPYKVIVSKKKYTDGNCTCYLGQNNTLCKHMIAVAIAGLKRGKPLTKEEQTQHNEILFSGKAKELTSDELGLFKTKIAEAMRYIKAYKGPSRIWFAYQDSLIEGCNRLSAIFSRLPANPESTDLIIKTLLKLDKKLQTGGVDDSDGTVGGFIEDSVKLLLSFVQVAPACAKSFKILKNIETCFGWEEPLLNYAKAKNDKFT